MKKNDWQYWEELSVDFQEARQAMWQVFGRLAKNTPQTSWMRGWRQIERGMSRMQSDLDGRVCEEHPYKTNKQLFGLFYPDKD